MKTKTISRIIPFLVVLVIAHVGFADGQLLNLSSRLKLPTRPDLEPVILGFVVSGPSSSQRNILIRTIGPTLGQFGVPNTANPVFYNFYRENTHLGTFFGWNESTMPAVFSSVGAFPLQTPGFNEAATVHPISNGFKYTAHATSGLDQSDKEILIELYDADSSANANKLKNLSIRHIVKDGDTLIGGLSVANGTKRVLIRAVGGGLHSVGVDANTPTMADPQITLYNSSGQAIASNANWQNYPQEQRNELIQVTATLGAFPLNSGNGFFDAAMLVTLPAGTYTAHVSNALSGVVFQGMVLLEIYDAD